MWIYWRITPNKYRCDSGLCTVHPPTCIRPKIRALINTYVYEDIYCIRTKDTYNTPSRNITIMRNRLGHQNTMIGQFPVPEGIQTYIEHVILESPEYNR